jgi:hypothetical protein
MKRPANPRWSLLLATSLAAAPVHAADETTRSWQAGTARPPAPSAPDQILDLRIYESAAFDRRLPYQPPARGNDRAFALDVQAVMTRCADGRQLITALVIGGTVTPLDARCPESAPPGDPAPQCDAKRWNCSTKPVP